MSKITNTLNSKYLENDIFIQRYIKPNISWYASYLTGKRGISRVFKIPYAALMKKFFLKSYFEKRVLEGKVDLPYLELVLTTKCTMRCESCNNMMQYFSPQKQYASTLKGIKTSLEVLLSKVDSIARVRIMGGEPLLFKELPELVEHLESLDKILTFSLVSNGSIDFSEDLLNALKNSKKLRKITISDYLLSPNLKIKLKQESILKNLKVFNIPYSLDSSGENAKWSSPGKIYKRNRPKEKIVENYHSCLMPCVSLMSAEGIRNEEGKLKENAHALAPKGAIFVCPVASSLSRLNGLEEFEGDFINLEDEKQRFLDFYVQDFFKACDYCHDMKNPSIPIPVAVQTDEILELKP